MSEGQFRDTNGSPQDVNLALEELYAMIAASGTGNGNSYDGGQL